MVIDKPTVNPDGIYNQRQAADALRIDRHTMARYAAKGLIEFREQSYGKSKVTTGAEIERCWRSAWELKF